MEKQQIAVVLSLYAVLVVASIIGWVWDLTHGVTAERRGPGRPPKEPQAASPSGPRQRTLLHALFVPATHGCWMSFFAPALTILLTAAVLVILAAGQIERLL